MAALPTCWVISDGRRGIENQALGLAESMAMLTPLNLKTHHLSRSNPRSRLPAGLQKLFKPKYKFPVPLPDIAIGCGRLAIPALIDLGKKDVFTAYVQDPRIPPNLFDVVIAPEHDQLSGDNVLSTLGSPNRITAELLAADKDLISPSDKKTAAFLIGGKSKTHRYSQADINSHAAIIADLLKSGWEIFLTSSRRTPIAALEYFSHFENDFDDFHFYAGRGPNPYFAYLYHADTIFVTEDSTNMLTEACATGKPVFRLPMSGYPGKFQLLYDRLETRCEVRPASAADLPENPYKPLRETERAAAFVWEKFHNRM